MVLLILPFRLSGHDLTTDTNSTMQCYGYCIQGLNDLARKANVQSSTDTEQLLSAAFPPLP